MNLDELLNNYDPIDIKYRKHFMDNVPFNENESSLFSFIPNKDECRKILLDWVLILKNNIYKEC